MFIDVEFPRSLMDSRGMDKTAGEAANLIQRRDISVDTVTSKLFLNLPGGLHI